MVELRQELEARSLSPKGLKSQLIARLTKTLRMEQEKEEKENGNEEVTRSSATAELARVSGHCTLQDHSRSLISVPMESLYVISY